MLDKTFDEYKFLFSGIIMAIIGIATACFKEAFLLPLFEYTSYYLMIKGSIELGASLIKKRKKRRPLTLTIGGILLYLVCNKLPFGPTFVYVTYLGIFCFIKMFSFFQYTKNKVPGNITTLMIGLIYLTAIIILIIHPINNLKYLSIFVGTIMTLFGLKNIFFSLSQIMPKNARKYLKFANRFPIPDIIAIFYPTELTDQINDRIKENKTDDFLSDNEKTDLQIYLHLSPHRLEALGHMELAFEGNIISYANYDRHSRKMFNITGDGVMVRANQFKYVNYQVNSRNKYLVEFGIKLTKEEKEKIRNKINELFNNDNIEYYTDKQRALRGEIPDRLFRDMSSEIYMYADGVFKKYIRGKNKVFSIPRNNCVYFMQQILKEIGIKLYSVNGFMSPGAFYDYFNYLYRLKYTNVITRRIYIKGCDTNARTTRSRNSKKCSKKASTK